MLELLHLFVLFFPDRQDRLCVVFASIIIIEMSIGYTHTHTHTHTSSLSHTYAQIDVTGVDTGVVLLVLLGCEAEHKK